MPRAVQRLAGAHAAPREDLAATIGRRVALVLIAVLLGGAVYLANASGVVRNGLPMPFGYGLATVESGSMEPAFSKGDLLVVRAVNDSSDIAVGDVVVYRSEQGSLVVHRVVAREGDALTTQGDANDSPDAPVNMSQVSAVVVAVLPGGGAVVDAMKSPVGIICLLVVAFLLVELPFCRHRDREDEERRLLQQEVDALKAQRSSQGALDLDDDWREW